MADDEKKHMPLWVKRLLIVVSIVGPLTGAMVTTISAYYDVKAKAKDASKKTEASYETLAPAIKELQTLLIKTQDVADASHKEIILLKADRDEKEKRILRLEAYVDILSRRRSLNLPAAPPEVQPAPEPVVSKTRAFKPPVSKVPDNVQGAQQMQEKL